MARLERISLVKTPDSAPQYELRVRNHGPGDAQYDIWQMPASATPQVTSAVRLAGLRGRNLDLVEHRVLKRLAQSGIKLGAGRDNRKRGYKLTEDLALMLGCFSAVSPPCASATTCGPWPKASRPWGPRKLPTGSAWPSIERTPGAC